MFVKFVKGLANEAYWLYNASLYITNEEWRKTFERHYRKQDPSRESKLKAIKRTFADLNIKLQPARIKNPIITFGSWKGIS